MSTDNHLLKIAFVGTAYHGFQVQRNAPTVCETLQNAMQAVLGARPDVKGCSRTDAGVHAAEYALSFHCETSVPPEKLPLALNTRLPRDIRALSAVLAPMDFHARYSALGKRYRYTVLNRAADDPFTLGQYYLVPRPVDAEAMALAARALVGRHNFAAFKGENGDVVPNTHRTMRALTVAREGDRVLIDLCADGFLYHMARLVAGTLLQVGLGRLPPETPAKLLQNKNAAAAGPALPAAGLCLREVFYPNFC